MKVALNGGSSSSGNKKNGSSSTSPSSLSSCGPLMGAMFGGNQMLPEDRRSILDLFSLYSKAVRITWTCDTTQFHCIADNEKCLFVTSNLDDFLLHAAETRRCENCDCHVHSNPQNVNSSSINTSETRFLCTRCQKPSSSESVGSKGLLLDMTTSTLEEPSCSSSVRRRPGRKSATSQKRRTTRSEEISEKVEAFSSVSQSSLKQEVDGEVLAKEEPVAPPRSSTSLGLISGSADDELAECPHCSRLLRKESLRTHVARRHENVRHHTCQFCDYQSYDAYVM